MSVSYINHLLIKLASHILRTANTTLSLTIMPTLVPLFFTALFPDAIWKTLPYWLTERREIVTGSDALHLGWGTGGIGCAGSLEPGTQLRVGGPQNDAPHAVHGGQGLPYTPLLGDLFLPEDAQALLAHDGIVHLHQTQTTNHSVSLRLCSNRVTNLSLFSHHPFKSTQAYFHPLALSHPSKTLPTPCQAS